MAIIQLTSRKCKHPVDPIFVDHSYIKRVKPVGGKSSQDMEGVAQITLMSGRVIDILESANTVRRKICAAFGVVEINDVPNCKLRSSFSRNGRQGTVC